MSIYSSASKTGIGAVGLMIRKKLEYLHRAAVKTFGQKSESLSSTLLSNYVPYYSDKEALFNDLHECLSKVQRHTVAVVPGDFNGRTGQDRHSPRKKQKAIRTLHPTTGGDLQSLFPHILRRQWTLVGEYDGFAAQRDQNFIHSNCSRQLPTATPRAPLNCTVHEHRILIQLDVRAAISLLSGNASPSTVPQANLPVAVTIMPTPFPKKTFKCFTPALLKLSKEVLQLWRAFGQGIFKAEEENDHIYIAYGRA